MNQHAPDSRPRLTAKQGQYLAFIHAYRRLLGQSPAEADMQRFFQVTSPSVHQMVLSLEKAGLIERSRDALGVGDCRVAAGSYPAV